MLDLPTNMIENTHTMTKTNQSINPCFPARYPSSACCTHESSYHSVVIPFVATPDAADAADAAGSPCRVAIRRRRLLLARLGRIEVLVLIERPGQLIRVTHLGVGVDRVRHAVLLERLLVLLVVEYALVGTDRDAAGAPLCAGTVALPADAAGAAQGGGAFLVVDLAVLVEVLVAKDAVQKPASAQVIGVDDATVAQLDTLAGPVDPSEIEVEGCLDDAEDDRDRVRTLVVGVEPANDPIDEVEGAVGAQEDDVEGGDDGGYGGLAEEEELREDTDRLEDLGEDPEPLAGTVRTLGPKRIMTGRRVCTSRKPQSSDDSKMSMTKGEITKHPARIRAASFHATSRSRVRGKTKRMTPIV